MILKWHEMLHLQKSLLRYVSWNVWQLSQFVPSVFLYVFNTFDNIHTRGSQPFGTGLPQNQAVPLCVPPNQNCIPFTYPHFKNSIQISYFWVVFKIWRTPVSFSLTPRGAYTPGWEPHCYTVYGTRVKTLKLLIVSCLPT